MYNIIGGDGKQYGPISAEQIQQWLAEGRLNQQSQVQAAGTADWKPLGSFPEFAAPLPVPPPFPQRAVAPTKTNGLAIAALVLGCLGWCTYGLTGVLGLIFGLIALRQIRNSQGTQGGRGLAMAGSIVGGISLLMLGLLLALAIPGFQKARTQSQARVVINQARQLDAAIDQWALEKGKQNGDNVLTNEVATYIKGDWNTTDPLGNQFVIGPVGPDQIKIAPATKRALERSNIDWGSY